jgi:hypothetical protein
MTPEQVPDIFKDVASQGAIAFVLTQLVKDVLMRWGPVDDQTSRVIALSFSVLIAALIFAPITPDWPRWILNVVGYGSAVIFPAATAAHVVAHKMAQKPAPK